MPVGAKAVPTASAGTAVVTVALTLEGDRRHGRGREHRRRRRGLASSGAVASRAHVRARV
jgi:hypothetical protein